MMEICSFFFQCRLSLEIKPSGMTTIVTPIAPVLAFSISALIGVIFGIYPSMRAAEMDPVEALRHE